MSSNIPSLEKTNKVTSCKERWQKGKELIREIPWESHAYWERPKSSQDTFELIKQNDMGKLSFLLAVKYGRMATSPFAFLRGSAAVMAADLSSTPVSGIETMLCGDAHLSNFGIFGSPEGKVIFDVNDFDESYPGPWEWDLKRLAVSAVLAGKQNGLKAEVNSKLAKRVARKYRNAITSFAKMQTLDVWDYTTAAKGFVNTFSASKKELKIMKKTLQKARTTTEEQTIKNLTNIKNGQRRFVDAKPLSIRLEDLPNSNFFSDSEKTEVLKNNPENAWHEYVNSLAQDKRTLLDRYHFVDSAFRVVGVGSVGTRCFISLLEANSQDDEIVLQQKEARASVLEPYLSPGKFTNHAERVVVGQRLLQSSSDIFLGWSHGAVSPEPEYYWRRLKDMKGSIEVSLLNREGLEDYLEACSVCLAHAHARSGDPIEIAGYLDEGSPFDDAIADFSVAYAKTTESDYKELLNGIKTGKINAENPCE